MVGEADTVSIILKRSQKEEKLHFRLQGRVAKLEESVSQGPRKNPAGFDFTFQSTITRGGRVEQCCSEKIFHFLHLKGRSGAVCPYVCTFFNFIFFQHSPQLFQCFFPSTFSPTFLKLFSFCFNFVSNFLSKKYFFSQHR